MRAKKQFENSKLLIETALNSIKDSEIDDNWSNTAINLIEMYYDDFVIAEIEDLDLKSYDLMVVFLERLKGSQNKR